jgi:hypothetical protein
MVLKEKHARGSIDVNFFSRDTQMMIFMPTNRRSSTTITTPEQYIEVTLALFELLSSRIPAMMASVKADLYTADPAEKEAIIKARLLQERVAIQREIKRPNFDDLSAYEHAASGDIARYLAAHPDIKRNMDAILARFEERTRP